MEIQKGMEIYLVIVMFFKGMIYNARRCYVFSSKEDAVKKMVAEIAEEAGQLIAGEYMDIEIVRLDEGGDKEQTVYKCGLSFNEEA